MTLPQILSHIQQELPSVAVDFTTREAFNHIIATLYKTTDISNIEFVDNAYLCIRVGKHRNSKRLVSIKPGNQSGDTYGYLQHFAYQPYLTIVSSRKGTSCQSQMDSES
jgi:hypothetical protein